MHALDLYAYCADLTANEAANQTCNAGVARKAAVWPAITQVASRPRVEPLRAIDRMLIRLILKKKMCSENGKPETTATLPGTGKRGKTSAA